MHSVTRYINAYGILKLSAVALKFCRLKGNRFFELQLLKDKIISFVNIRMGLIKLRIREFANEKGWTLKDVSDRSGVAYSSVRAYARAPGLAMVDFY